MKFLTILVCLAFVLTVSAVPIYQYENSDDHLDLLPIESEETEKPDEIEWIKITDEKPATRNDQTWFDLIHAKIDAEEDRKLVNANPDANSNDDALNAATSPPSENLKSAITQNEAQYAVSSVAAIDFVGRRLTDLVNGIKSGLSGIDSALDVIAAIWFI